MEAVACYKYARISAQKVRLIADLIRPMSIEKALDTLTFSRKRAAQMVKKVLESAIANAETNEGADIDELKIEEIFIDEGPRMKRWHARAKGRGARILKRMCHITIKVTDSERG